MPSLPSAVTDFLSGTRFAVAGVSRDRRQPANAIFRKLRASDREVFAVNPRAEEVEGIRCHPDLASVPGPIHGVVIATAPSASVSVVRECAALGIRHVWLHRSFGEGSVSEDAVREASALGLSCIEGGCPMMYVPPVDVFHRCMRWWLGKRGRVPG